MQSLPTLTVRTLYAGIIRLVLFHLARTVARRITAADTIWHVVGIVAIIYHYFNIAVFFLIYRACCWLRRLFVYTVYD